MSMMQLVEMAARNNPTVAAALADANAAELEATHAEAELEHEEQTAIDDAKGTIAALTEQKDLSTQVHAKKHSKIQDQLLGAQKYLKQLMSMHRAGGAAGGATAECVRAQGGIDPRGGSQHEHGHQPPARSRAERSAREAR